MCVVLFVCLCPHVTIAMPILPWTKHDAFYTLLAIMTSHNKFWGERTSKCPTQEVHERSGVFMLIGRTPPQSEPLPTYENCVRMSNCSVVRALNYRHRHTHTGPIPLPRLLTREVKMRPCNEHDEKELKNGFGLSI